MRILEQKSALLAAALVVLIPLTAGAQSAAEREKAATQSQITNAEAALASAQASGAPTLAPALYEEAARRLQIARGNWTSNDRDARNLAALRAIEAGYAAAAAEAQAQLVATNSEVRSLRSEIGTFGGTAAELALYDPPTGLSPGATSMDRVIVAENALASARSAGGARVAAADLERAEAILKSARTVARHQRQSQSADHLAFVAEMLARRAEYLARRDLVMDRLPQLRSERTRLAQQAAQRRAEEEQARRREAERQAADLEAQLRAQIQQDREARLAAEQALDDVRRRYEAALAERSTNSAELESLRRQLEDQSLALRSVQERERQSEASLAYQVSSLESALARERNEGRLTAEVLAQRETELRT
ncbi:MAG TPA: hypothetical protein VHL59_15705, partial [Thermoanaerobaculia bacterium]|nr:hypothetical protein [Thermoanaerobaculia bacterium]